MDYKELPEQPTPKVEVWQRALRTFIQLVAAGGLTALTDQIGHDLPVQYSAYFVIFYGFLVSFAQNYAESQGWIPTILKKADRNPNQE